MNTIIIYAHPYEKSFNNAILNEVQQVLNNTNRDFTTLDLYKDSFNPVYSKEELQFFSDGKALDPLIIEYQQLLKDADHLIFIFPIWWHDTPAIVKGFFDKVMLNKFSYIDTKTGIQGQLTNIKSAKIITTSKSPTWFLRYFGGNAINKVVIKSTLKGIGVRNSKWINFDKVATSEERRINFLENLKNNI